MKFVEVTYFSSKANTTYKIQVELKPSQIILKKDFGK